MTVVALADARDEGSFGGKGVQLGAGIRAGLPVPDGFALAAELVEAVARGDQAARANLDEICARLTGPLAVRSSAIGEDSAAASFAGQHATFLNVRGGARRRPPVLTRLPAERGSESFATSTARLCAEQGGRDRIAAWR